jgi:cobalamin biosynthesis Mg chelatase CobN
VCKSRRKIITIFQISGFFRDVFPNLVHLVDEAKGALEERTETV